MAMADISVAPVQIMRQVAVKLRVVDGQFVIHFQMGVVETIVVKMQKNQLDVVKSMDESGPETSVVKKMMLFLMENVVTLRMTQKDVVKA